MWLWLIICNRKDLLFIELLRTNMELHPHHRAVEDDEHRRHQRPSLADLNGRVVPWKTLVSEKLVYFKSFWSCATRDPLHRTPIPQDIFRIYVCRLWQGSAFAPMLSSWRMEATAAGVAWLDYTHIHNESIPNSFQIDRRTVSTPLCAAL